MHMTDALVLITGDTHLGSNHTDFLPYFDPQYRPAYQEFLETAALAQKIQAERLAKAAAGGKGKAMGGDAMSMMAAAPGRMLDMLVDRRGDGSVPYSREYIAENQKIRREVIRSLGYDKFDEDEFMSVLGEDDPDLRLKMLEVDGTVGQVLFPQVGFLLSSVGPELLWAGIRAYNRFAAEFAKSHPDRYAATFMVDLSNIERACEEARFAGENGMRGGAYIAGGRPPGLPAFSESYYEPFFKTLEEFNLPFNMHGAFSPGGNQAGWVAGPGAAVFNQIWINYLNLNKGGPLMHFLSGGVFERHPKLKIVVAESGGLYWATEVLQTLDEIYNSTDQRTSISLRNMNPNTVKKFKEFPRKPSDYFKTNVYVQGHNSALDWKALRTVGIDNVVWSSDFPHAESTWPYSVQEIKKLMADTGTSIEDARKFLGLNAAKLYGFDVKKLQPIADRVGPKLTASAAA